VVETKIYDLEAKHDELSKKIANINLDRQNYRADNSPRRSELRNREEISSKISGENKSKFTAEEGKTENQHGFMGAKVVEKIEKDILYLDDAREKLDSEINKNQETLNKSIAAIRSIQKAMADKLKLKIKLDGLDDDSEAKGPSFQKEPASGNNRPKMFAVPSSPQKQSSIDMDDFGKFILKEISKYALKENVDTIESSLKTMNTILLTKADKKDMETIDTAISGDLKKLSARIDELELFKKAIEKRLNQKDQDDGARDQIITDHTQKVFYPETVRKLNRLQNWKMKWQNCNSKSKI